MSFPLDVTRNILKAWSLFAIAIAGLTALGWWLGDLRLASVFFVVALLMAATITWYGPRVVLASLGARELTLAEAPALHSTAERLAARAQLPRPRLYLLDEPHPHAFAVGRGASDPNVALSRGLILLCSPAELDGIIAHELGHVRRRDVAIVTPAVILATALLELSRVGGALSRALLFVLGPIAAATVHTLLSPKREFGADREAASLCESPHGLADALLRLEAAQSLVSFRASPATGPLYTLNPFGPDRLSALFDTHPPIAERVERLRELDPEWRERLRAGSLA